MTCAAQPLSGPGFCMPHAEQGVLRCTDSLTLELVEEKPEIYTLPDEDDDSDGVANWFDCVETVASDAPMEYSDQYFSIHDKINTIAANDEAFLVLSNAIYAMTGMKMKKSMLAMMGEKTFAELNGLMSSMGGAAGASDADAGKKIPDNALQIINAELNKIKK